MKKQIISIVLAVSMLATMLTAFMLPAFAASDEMYDVAMTQEKIAVDGKLDEVYLESTKITSVPIHGDKTTGLKFEAYVVADYTGFYVWTNIIGEKTYVNTDSHKDYLQIYYNMSEKGKQTDIGYFQIDYNENLWCRNKSGYESKAPEGASYEAFKTDTGWVSEIYIPWRAGTAVYNAMQKKDASCYFGIGFQYNDDTDGDGKWNTVLYDDEWGGSYWSTDAGGYAGLSVIKFATATGRLSKTNVFLDGDIAVDYDVTLGGLYDADKTFVRFTVTGANGENKYEIPGVLVDPATDTYNYSLGLAPHRMGDTIKVELVSDGEVIHSREAFSIKSYCLDMYNSTLEASKLTPNQYAAMKNLVIDMLHYGAVAQEFMDYDTENLVNKGLEIKDFEDFQMRPISYEEIVISESAKAGTEFTATSLYFDSSNRMCFKFKTDDIDNVVVNIGDGTPGFAAKDLAYTYIEDEDVYVVYTDIIDPADYNKVFNVRLVNINDKGTAYESRTVIQTVNCSVNAYLGTTVAKYQPDMFEDMDAAIYTILAQSAYNYGNSMVLFAGA